MNCVFCRIVAGELPGTFVYRDERCAAFMGCDSGRTT
jgi:diadenosine tetraphosphate (Ap4A) HIT family hydrolase